jgi:hypothetical protein
VQTDLELSTNVAEGRSPYEWERTEFSEWYELASSMRIANDYQWDGGQYRVLSAHRWISFPEMIGMFSLTRLRAYLSFRFEGFLDRINS